MLSAYWKQFFGCLMLILLAILLFLSVLVILICTQYTDYAELYFCCFRRSTDFLQTDCIF
ncbi:hypothetical protein D7X88_12460 [bacterium C-53]|nr:hypothetical protein [Lachnospiraceae bacterium]NBI03830.1 hypothetical protein [Lachnospiraceae bacterium]RKJ09177.1 hypothetical protein D7X88_12460 [bacterium C-53]